MNAEPFYCQRRGDLSVPECGQQCGLCKQAAPLITLGMSQFASTEEFHRSSELQRLRLVEQAAIRLHKELKVASDDIDGRSEIVAALVELEGALWQAPEQ